MINVQEIELFYKNFPPSKIKTARSGFYTSKPNGLFFSGGLFCCLILLSIHEESSDIESSDSNDYLERYRAAQSAAWGFNVKENKQFSYNFALIAMQSIAWLINVEENSLFSKNRRRKASLVGFVLKNKIDDRQERIDDLWNQRIQNFILLTLVAGYTKYQLG